MALLDKIRSYRGIMMLLIIVAVFGFLFMDVSSVGRGFGGQSRILGTIGGVDISRDELESYVSTYEKMGAANNEQTRNSVWEELVNDKLYRIQAKKMGISISEKELEDMFVGENVSPIVMQAMGGKVERAQLEQQRNQYLQLQQKSVSELNENEKNYLELWQGIERMAIDQRITSKYTNLIAKSNYAPSWMTKAEFDRNNRTYDLNFVRVMYADVPNTEAPVSDAEMTAYIKENAKQYEREANVSLEYVVFDVLPTAEDTLKYIKRMTDLAAEFATTENDTTFVTNNRGRMDYKFLTKNDINIPENLKDSLFRQKKGGVFGPFMDAEGNFQVVKVMETKEMPDSIKCRHIFRPAGSRDMNELQKNYTLLDSLKKLLVEKKVSFDSLVVQHSMDITSKDKGGNLGWRKKGDPFGQNFEDFLYHVGKKDSFEIIQTNEGLHLIQINEFKIGKEKGMKLSTILEPIIPSTATEDIVEAKANEFMANNRTLQSMRDAVKKNPSIKKMNAYGLQINDFRLNEQVTGTVASEIIRWAHKEAKKDEVAGQIFPVADPKGNFSSQIIIPALLSKSNKGLATIQDENVKKEVEQLVRNKKKAEIIAKKIQGYKSLDDIVAKYSNAKVETANSVSYSSPFIPAIGVEPKVLGMAEATEVNKISTPVSGMQGVYVIQVTNKINGPAMDNPSMARKSITDRMMPASKLKDVLSNALREILVLKDNRADAY